MAAALSRKVWERGSIADLRTLMDLSARRKGRGRTPEECREADRTASRVDTMRLLTPPGRGR